MNLNKILPPICTTTTMQNKQRARETCTDIAQAHVAARYQNHVDSIIRAHLAQLHIASGSGKPPHTPASCTATCNCNTNVLKYLLLLGAALGRL